MPTHAWKGWKYINLGRPSIYIEQLIEEGANWAVFEPKRAVLGRSIDAAPERGGRTQS